jgi:hypothetical protein
MTHVIPNATKDGVTGVSRMSLSRTHSGKRHAVISSQSTSSNVAKPGATSTASQHDTIDLTDDDDSLSSSSQTMHNVARVSALTRLMSPVDTTSSIKRSRSSPLRHRHAHANNTLSSSLPSMSLTPPSTQLTQLMTKPMSRSNSSANTTITPSSTPTTSSLVSCLICGQSLTHLSTLLQQRHLNECLDASSAHKSSSSSSSPSSTSSILTPKRDAMKAPISVSLVDESDDDFQPSEPRRHQSASSSLASPSVKPSRPKKKATSRGQNKSNDHDDEKVIKVCPLCDFSLPSYTTLTYHLSSSCSFAAKRSRSSTPSPTHMNAQNGQTKSNSVIVRQAIELAGGTYDCLICHIDLTSVNFASRVSHLKKCAAAAAIAATTATVTTPTALSSNRVAPASAPLPIARLANARVVPMRSFTILPSSSSSPLLITNDPPTLATKSKPIYRGVGGATIVDFFRDPSISNSPTPLPPSATSSPSTSTSSPSSSSSRIISSCEAAATANDAAIARALSLDESKNRWSTLLGGNKRTRSTPNAIISTSSSNNGTNNWGRRRTWQNNNKNGKGDNNNKSNGRSGWGSGQINNACPFYKRIEGTHLIVDGFRYGSTAKSSAHFLSHFHSDHYIGITTKWCYGTIYCSTITARMLAKQYRLHAPIVCALPLNQRVNIDGVAVTMIGMTTCIVIAHITV